MLELTLTHRHVQAREKKLERDSKGDKRKISDHLRGDIIIIAPQCVDSILSLASTTPQIDLLLWPAVQVVNFYYVPATFRVVFLNTFNMVWTMILSYLKHHVSCHILVYTTALICCSLVRFL